MMSEAIDGHATGGDDDDDDDDDHDHDHHIRNRSAILVLSRLFVGVQGQKRRVLHEKRGDGKAAEGCWGAKSSMMDRRSGPLSVLDHGVPVAGPCHIVAAHKLSAPWCIP